MIREYEDQDVYEALQQRLEYLFEEFDNIYISFSGAFTRRICCFIAVEEFCKFSSTVIIHK